MNWQNIIKKKDFFDFNRPDAIEDTEPKMNFYRKNDEREDLEIKLEDLVDKWGEDKDISDYEYFADRNGPNLDGVEIDVTFEDMYEGEEDLSQEEKLEEDVGYYRIVFSSQRYEEFAMGDYTYDNGFQIHEYNLDIKELQAAVRGLQ